MWIVYALLTILFYAGLDYFVKKAAGRIDDYLGSVIINFFAVLPALLIFIWLKVSKAEIFFTRDGIINSIIAGLSIGIGTITFIKLFSLGTNISLASPIVRVGTVILTTAIGLLILRETFSLRQSIGFVLSLLGLMLLIFK